MFTSCSRQTINGLFYLITIEYRIFRFKKGLSAVLEYDKVRHILLTSPQHNNDVIYFFHRSVL